MTNFTPVQLFSLTAVWTSEANDLAGTWVKMNLLHGAGDVQRFYRLKARFGN